MAAPDTTPPAGGRKVKPGQAVVVVAVVALAGILYIRYRSSKTSGAGSSTPGTVTSSTTYGLGPEWFATWTKDHHGPPSKKHPRKFTDWQGHR